MKHEILSGKGGLVVLIFRLLWKRLFWMEKNNFIWGL